ncbi:MAG: hypothetical protein CMM58_11165 [Rhodospirillaceae bacterium]|nr:hypothetical protein [Rhodospirillaceae bacterium]|tara:strand:- start:905 stop:1939 length:1035 start_codon:yes stop_codon:yes gene_type:complete
MEKMGEFRDSTPHKNNGSILKERLNTDGYLFIKDLLPKQRVTAVRNRLLEKASRGGWFDVTEPLSNGVANLSAACKDPEEKYMKVFRTMWRDEKLHRLRTHENVLELFQSIFGEPAFAHPMFVQRNIFPQHGDFDFTTGAHQDKVHIGGDTNYAMWVPIGCCPLEKGPLAVASGSHMHGILDTRVGTGAGGMDISGEIPGKWVTGEFNAGDVLIFCDTTVHKALPNRSKEIRQSFDARYQPVSQQIARPNMAPYSGTGTWEEVYSEWESEADQYYWEELDLDVVEFDRSYYEQRDEMAFEMAEKGDLLARDTLLRIIQRDANNEKIARAQRLVAAMDNQNTHRH